MDALSSSTSSSTFKVGGLVSGLKTDDIIAQLMDIEKKPIARIESKKLKVTEQLTAWRELNTRLSALQASASSLKQVSTFQGRLAFSSNEDILTVKASSGSNTAAQTVTVKKLAQNHQAASQPYIRPTDIIGTGTVSITIGSSTKTVTLDSEHNTLASLRDTINNGDYGASASITQVGTDQYKLILTSKTSGASGNMTVNMNLTGGTQPAFSTIQAGQDAHVVLGTASEGVTPVDIYSSSNTLTDVIQGVTINLVSADETKPVNITLSTDASTTQNAVDNFIKQFNNMVDYFDKQFFYDSNSKKTGTLFSNTELMGIREDLYSSVTDTVGGEGKYHNLSQIGISLDKTGKLYIQDSSAFTKAVTENQGDLISFFTDKENGLGNRINNYLTKISDPAKGILTTTDDSFEAEIESLTKSITAKNERLARVESDYYKKFGRLESAMSKLQSQGNYLGMQIASMMGTSDS